MCKKNIGGSLVLLFFFCFFPADACPADPGSIKGQVTVTNFPENALGFTVEAVDNSENVITSAITGSDGTYELTGITSTQAYVRVPEQFGYKKTFYANESLIANADPVTIIPNGIVNGIDISIEELITQPDNDGDGIRDAEEVVLGSDGYRTSPGIADTDNDGIDDLEETTPGTDAFFTNPLLADSDNDSIGDSTDTIPAHTYVKMRVTHGVLASESTTVVAEIRDLYHNLINKNGIEFSLTCTGSAVFASSANTGTLVSGGGTSTAVVQTTGGVVSIDISSSVVENVAIQAVDSDSLGLLTFSAAVPYYSGYFQIPEMGSAMTDSPVQFVDDFERNVPVNIAFTFFGQAVANADIHSNGFITFTLFEGIPTEAFYQQMYTNDPIPDASIPDNFIAPYWDDLNIESHGTGKISYGIQQNNAGTIFRIRWKDHGIYDSRELFNASLTFHAVLFEHSNLILFHYEKLVNGQTRIADGRSATVGLENSSGALGVQFSYNTSSVSEGMSIILSTADDTTAHFLPSAGDYDNDGLSNEDERTISFTDPVNPDTDSDGLPDKWEHDYGLDPTSSTGINGAEGDFDNDGLSNENELSILTAPNDSDSDDDGLSDGDEVLIYQTQPKTADTDGDTLSDGEEAYYGTDGFRTDPRKQDSDNDGVNDAVDPIPVHARLVIIKPPDTFIGNPAPAPVKFQLWSLDGDLLTPVNTLVIDAQVSGSAFFADPAVKGSILNGAGTNSVRVQLNNGEAHLRVWNFTEETVSFSVSDPFTSGVRFPMSAAGFENVSSRFADISSGENLVPLTGDDVSASLTLPPGFFFRFFGDLYSSVNTLKISSNGYITFSPHATAVSNKTIPYHGSNDPDAYIAPFWDDLAITSGAVYAAVLGSAPSRRFVVQWSGISLASAPQLTLTFQIILYELDSLIEFQYGTLANNGSSATVGIENATGTNGVLVGYNSAVLSSQSGIALFDGTLPSMRFINGDYDGDGLSDLDEINTHGTDPALRDTDGDGLEDNTEISVHNTDPVNADPDNDGLNDMQEIFDYGTDPFNADSDNDSFSDYQEAVAGTDPNDAESYLRVTVIRQNPPTLGFIIEWNGVAGKTYRIWAKDGSLGPDFVLLKDNVAASEPVSSYQDEGDEDKEILHPQLEPARLYKITVVE
ncbi:MAG: hypothetical protein C4541_07540 [Candidatus Auribacter fodinae]|jgi:hypothetical protein|uniref:Carboxypeptidase regulatory-like domain-containing protein n=1 Tax=Candidatus Auribacter fodinae TaxID=2093366 RepID=A0A3A4R787_9BACT|nr:MAG: hypothetical protein C4541_07540 [Candidatus Auribacter fodinae]